MTQTLNFNQWIKNPKVASQLGHVWVPRKGRPTRESVEKRAREEYRMPGAGYAAWDAYLDYLNEQNPNPNIARS